MSINFLKSVKSGNLNKNKNLIRLVIIISYVLFACTEEKLPKPTGYGFHKIFPPDSSLSYQVKDTLVHDTLSVKISLTNTSKKPVYIPLNNWFIYGWPHKGRVTGNDIFPDYYNIYHFNVMFYNWEDEWRENYDIFWTPPFSSFPIVEKLNPGITMHITVNIVNSEFTAMKNKKVKIRANIIYSLMEDHKKLVKIFNIDERRINRESETIKFIFNLNNEDTTTGIDNGKPFVQYSDSTGIDILGFFTDIKENPYITNLIIIGEIILYYRVLGYEFGSNIFENYLDEIRSSQKISIEEIKDKKNDNDYIIWLRTIFNEIFKLTYHNSIEIRN